jgi:hypothetical protein
MVCVDCGRYSRPCEETGYDADDVCPDCAEKRDAVGLCIDMLDADRLNEWGRLIDIHGSRIDHWGDPVFVAQRMREIAARIAAVVKEVGELRAKAGV